MPAADQRGPSGLIFDPFAGISGDMLLGALVDLGLGAEWLRDHVADLAVDADVQVGRADRSGISCGRVSFAVAEQTRHRHLPDVLEIVDRSSLPDGVRERAGRVFRRLAEAEAAVHGVPPDKVHFHEVGAVDSILDVLLGVGGLAALGYERFFTRAVAVGSGTVRIAHGTYPLPAPATGRLLAGMPVRETGYAEECTTPTGAAILAELTGGAPAPRQAIYGRSGFGAGTRDPDGRPNCLRVIECAAVDGDHERLVVVQTDIDDMAPEYVAAARDALEAAGAVDVTLVRVDMKKGRPGVRLELLTPETRLERVLDALFRGTATIGVRYWAVDRVVLERTEEVIEWRGHPIRVKRVRLPGGGSRRKPEYDDVARAAESNGSTPGQVRAELDRLLGQDAPND